MTIQHRIYKNKLIKIIQFSLIIVVITLAIWSIDHLGIEQIRLSVGQMGIWGFVAIGGLRLTSVIIPALPGTGYSILAGGLFGFIPGLIIICVADFVSCSLSFALSRRYGRSLVTKIAGERTIKYIDRFSQRNLENNFCLMTACLMTGFFDFVTYGVGLTKTPWRKFVSALLISIILSNLPIVALGAGLLTSGKQLLGFGILGIFILGLITAKLKQKLKI